MTVVVTTATADDMPDVFVLRHEVFVIGQGVPPELELDELDAVCVHAVARVDGRVVGTGRLLPPEGGIGTVGRMAVAADARGNGIGAAVLAHLEDEARRRGDVAVELHAQVHAQGFYERAGYVAFGGVYEEAGIDHVSMRKDLGRAGPV